MAPLSTVSNPGCPHGNILQVSYPHLIMPPPLSLPAGHLSAGEREGIGWWRRQSNAITCTKHYPAHDSFWFHLPPHSPLAKIYITLFAWLSKRREHSGKRDGWRGGKNPTSHTHTKSTQTERKGRSKDNYRGIFWIFFPWLINKINKVYC